MSCVTYPAIVVVTALAWFWVVRSFGLLVPRDVRAWRHLAEIHGYKSSLTAWDRLGRRFPAFDRLFAGANVARLLAVAGKDETVAQFWGKTIAYVFGALVAGLLLDAATMYLSGVAALAPGLIVVVAGCVAVLRFVSLRTQAIRAREQAEDAVGDLLMTIASMSGERGTPLQDALMLLSRAVDAPALQRIVWDQGWRRLVKDEPRSTTDLYQAIAKAYGMPVFDELATALLNTQVGLPEREVYTKLALTIYGRRLQEARIASAQAKTKVVIPIALMLIPLMALLGAPAFWSIAHSMGG